MVALTSSDVTVSVLEQEKEEKQRRNRVQISFGNASKTYPSGGVPMPDREYFGMRRNLDTLIVNDISDSDGVLWKYDNTNKKLRGYRIGATVGPTAAARNLTELVTSVAPTATVMFAEALGW